MGYMVLCSLNCVNVAAARCSKSITYFDAVSVPVLDELFGVEIHLDNMKSTLESAIFCIMPKKTIWSQQHPSLCVSCLHFQTVE